MYHSLVRIHVGFCVCVVRKQIVGHCFLCTLCVLDTSASDSTSLSNICLFTCVTGECIHAAFIVFLCICVCGFGFVSWYNVFVFLNAMPTSVCLKRLVTFLIVGL